MFLSIIIPHYNIPRELLERCLHSIQSQGIPNDEYEIILVDDASGTPPTWVTGTNANVRLIINGHTGPGGTRNKGIENATGEYIMFVDADDFLFNNGEILSCIEKLKCERPHILRYNYIVRKDCNDTTTTPRKRIRFSNTISGAAYMESNNLSGSSCTFFFKRELATKKGIRFPENVFHEDEEFNTILHYHAQTLIDSNANLYCYCTRNGSTTANSSEEFENRRISDFIYITERLQAFAQSQAGKSNAIQTRAIEHKLDTLTVDAILNMMYAGMSAESIIKRCTENFSPIGLYPLRKATYSLKYRIFRYLANKDLGIKLLRIIIPSKKPAKR